MCTPLVGNTLIIAITKNTSDTTQVTTQVSVNCIYTADENIYACTRTDQGPLWVDACKCESQDPRKGLQGPLGACACLWWASLAATGELNPQYPGIIAKKMF